MIEDWTAYHENIGILKSINEFCISLYAEMFLLSMFVYEAKKVSIQENILVPNPSYPAIFRKLVVFTELAEGEGLIWVWGSNGP